MIKNTLSIVALLSVALLVACGFGHEYKLAMNPPANDASPQDIFPSDIEGEEAVPNNLEKGGIECFYGQDKAITVVRLSSKEEAEAFFKQNLLQEFKDQPSNFSGNINGQFYAKAGGGAWKMFGWVNQNFAFVIKATDSDGLDKVVEAFRYIEKK